MRGKKAPLEEETFRSVPSYASGGCMLRDEVGGSVAVIIEYYIKKA